MDVIDPSEVQMREYAAADPSGPVVIINLHKYYEKANYPEPFQAGTCSGREAYRRYMAGVEPLMESVGGRIRFMGPVEQVLIGEGDWDEAVIGEWPSRRAAMSLPDLPGYARYAVHREAGLQRVITLVCTERNLSTSGRSA